MIQKNLSDLFGRNWLNVKVKFDDAEIGLSYKSANVELLALPIFRALAVD